MNINDKKNWYDGSFYEKFIDPIAGKSYIKTVLKFIDENSNVLDIGCGTGSLALGLSKKCKNVTGVDLSSKMINFAKKRTKNIPVQNVEFIHLSATGLADLSGKKYDYVIMTQLLHELSENERIDVMGDVKKITKKIIIADFLSPQPRTLAGKFISFIELTAGKEHNKNFKNWTLTGGIDKFIINNKLKVEEEKIYRNKTGKIVKASVL